MVIDGNTWNDYLMDCDEKGMVILMSKQSVTLHDKPAAYQILIC